MNLVEQLKQEIEKKVDQIVALTDEVERLREALQVLDPGEDSEVRSPTVERVATQPRQVPPPSVSFERPPESVDTRPLCGGCGGRMVPAFRTLQSGKTVNYLTCTDSSCNNEAFA